MSIFFAALSALSYGAADYAGGKATRSHNVLGVLVLSQIVGLAGIFAIILVLRQPLSSGVDLAWGVAAGLSGVLGLSSLYRGLASGAAAIVSPTAALFGSAAPILAGLLLAEMPTLTGWMGIGVALPAIVLLSLTRDAGVRFDRQSLLFGIVAGIGFGGYFILIDRTAPDSGFWPLASARIASISVVALTALVTKGSLRVSRQARRPTLLAGALDMAANVFFLLATRVGLLVTSAVVSSLYPAPTVLLARALDKQRLGPRRIVGLLLSLAGVALMAI